jgi:heavy metal sensor kinase
MKTLSLRSRLTLWYVAVLVVVLCAFGAGVVWMQGRLGVGRIDRQLADVEGTVVKIIANELREQSSPAAAAAEASDTVADSNVTVAILDARGVPLASKAIGVDLGELLPKEREGFGRAPIDQGETFSTTQTSAGAWRIRSRPESVEGRSLVVVVASPLADIHREQRETWEAMLIAIPILLLLAGAGGWWLASVGLAPITDMARRAVRLPLTGSEDLGEPTRGDEIGQLTRAFNGLVARLRAALRTQRQFMADASHELRTPVSIIRSAADVALSRDRRNETEYRESLAIVGDQSRRLGRLVEDMLVLARADAGGYPIHDVELDLAEVVDDCRRAVRVIAAERGVQMQSAAGPEVPFRGDEDLLRRMVQNLLQNAIQHTPSGRSVGVAIESGTGEVKIRVADGGAGIPEADRCRIFDRFVRLDEARTGNGTGLGLPIAKWIAEAHGGTLVLESSGAAGSTFCATLRTTPRSEDPCLRPPSASAPASVGGPQ